MLEHVPPDAIAGLEPLEERADSLDRDVAAADTALQQAQRAEALQQDRLENARASVDAEARLKEIAVERGDVEGGAAADQRREAAEGEVERARADLERATMARIRAEARLDLLEAEQDVVDARIERDRARAVAQKVDDFDVQPYEKALDAAAEQRDRAAAHARDVGAAPIDRNAG
ncbi:MAG: hypothetical protein R3F59_19895 [Myxococcota bacterium]